MSALEFEQKFVLDPAKADEIMEHLVERSIAGDKHQVIHIRQFYDKNGERYRGTLQSSALRFIKETKKSIKIGSPYSINSETEKVVTREEFEAGWTKNSAHRLQKTRFEVPGRHPDHKVIVDFFYTFDDGVNSKPGTLKGGNVYAIIAEDETMLTPETENLYLRFSLPIYLEEYCLLTVDDSNTEHKIFKSTNMVDTPETVQAVRKAIRRLYDPV